MKMIHSVLCDFSKNWPEHDQNWLDCVIQQETLKAGTVILLLNVDYKKNYEIYLNFYINRHIWIYWQP